MKAAQPTFLLLAIILSSVAPAIAGDAGYSQHAYASTAVCSKKTWNDRPRALRILGFPVVFLGRVGETILHSPQILAEGVEGDRVLANRHGLLAPREVPVEECIISPED